MTLTKEERTYMEQKAKAYAKGLELLIENGVAPGDVSISRTFMREILIKADDYLVGLALQIEHGFEEITGKPVDWDPDANFTPLEHQLHVIASVFGWDYVKDISDEAYRRRKERRKEIEDRRRQLEGGDQ
jgi:hypothetical protein